MNDQRERALALAKELRRPRVAYTLDDAADLIEKAFEEWWSSKLLTDKQIKEIEDYLKGKFDGDPT